MLQRTRDLPKAVEEALLQRIESGRYRPGSRLASEAALAKELGVSRATLREGLRHLSRMGVIEVVRGASGGMFVRQADSSIVLEAITLLLRLRSVSVNDLMEARRALAPPIAALAAEQATPQDFDRLEGLLAAMEQRLDGGKPPQESLLNFHNHLVAMTRNDLLVALVQPLNEIAANFLKRFWRVSLASEMRQGMAGHRALLEALRKSDGDGAHAAMVALLAART